MDAATVSARLDLGEVGKGASARPYTDCPYLPFFDCAEGMAWKNAWLNELEKAKLAKRPSHGRINSPVHNPATK